MPRTYTIPAKPKDDAGHLELIARIVFIIGFNYAVVAQRWPKIRKAFAGFDVKKAARLDPEKVMGADGMIRNRRKIAAVIANAKACEAIIKEHGSMAKWVKSVAGAHGKDPIFSASLAEECERRFAGIGKTTREWVAYVFKDGKARPERRTA